MNKVILVGSLARDVHEAKTRNNKTRNHFVIAVKDESGNTDFVTVVAYDKLGENLAKWKKKGDGIAVVGRMKSYKVGDVYKEEIVADSIEFLNSGKKVTSESSNARELEDLEFVSKSKPRYKVDYVASLPQSENYEMD